MDVSRGCANRCTFRVRGPERPDKAALRRLFSTASAIVALAAGVSSPFAVANSHNGSETAQAPRELTTADIASLLDMAGTYPCATLAMLQILQSGLELKDGSLYLEHIPTPEQVGHVLGRVSVGRSAALEQELQRNPYSGAAVFVQVRWQATPSGTDAYAVRFQAQLVDRSGHPLLPKHPIEASATVLVEGDSIRVLFPHASQTPHEALRTFRPLNHLQL